MREEAREWFARAAEADTEGETDAAERLLELDGVDHRGRRGRRVDEADGDEAEADSTSADRTTRTTRADDDDDDDDDDLEEDDDDDAAAEGDAAEGDGTPRATRAAVADHGVTAADTKADPAQ